MKHIALKSVSAVLVLSIILSAAPLSVFAVDVIEIASAADFENIGNDLSGHYKLIDDICLTQGLSYGVFTGVFDGNGHTVTLALDETGGGPSGVFLRAADCTVKDLEVVGTVTSTGGPTGALIGSATGSVFIDSVTVGADVTTSGSDGAGGFIGSLSDGTATLKNCVNEGNVISYTSTAGAFAGAICSGTLDLSDCTNAGRAVSGGYTVKDGEQPRLAARGYAEGVEFRRENGKFILSGAPVLDSVPDLNGYKAYFNGTDVTDKTEPVCSGGVLSFIATGVLVRDDYASLTVVLPSGDYGTWGTPVSDKYGSSLLSYADEMIPSLTEIPVTGYSATDGDEYTGLLDGDLAPANNEGLLFDGRTDTEMGGFAYAGQDVAVFFSSDTARKAGYYALGTGHDDSGFRRKQPASWKLYGSANGIDYVEIASVDDMVMPGYDSELVLFEASADEAYQYYKIVISKFRFSIDNPNAKSSYVQISELRIYEALPEAEVTADQTSVNKGQEVEFTVNLRNFDLIKSLTVRPLYDPAVFELVSGEWQMEADIAAFDKSSGIGAAAWRNYVDASGAVFKFTLKAKTEADSAEVGCELKIQDMESGEVTASNARPADVSVIHVHVYGEWTVAKEPSLTEGGLLTRTCADDASHIDAFGLPALNNIDYIYNVTGDPTCTEEGGAEYTYIKDGKGFTFEVILAEAAHTLVKHNEIPATCTEAGTGEYWQCSECGKLFSDSEGKTEISEIPALPIIAHTLVKHNEVPASCTEAGTGEYWQCSECGKLFSDSEGENEISEIPALPIIAHTLVKHNEIPATCTEAGTGEYWECSECGKLFGDAEGKIEISEIPVTPALGHTYTYTCNGDAAHTVGCTRCDYSAVEDCIDEDYNGKCDKCGVVILPGDFDCDGKLTSDDAIELLDRIKASGEYDRELDVNNDGKTDDEDSVYLLYHVFYKELYPLFPEKEGNEEGGN